MFAINDYLDRIDLVLGNSGLARLADVLGQYLGGLFDVEGGLAPVVWHRNSIALLPRRVV